MTEHDRFLESFGWDNSFKASFESFESFETAGLSVGRIIGQGRGSYRVQISTNHSLDATINSKFRKATSADKSLAYPAVGDWVAFSFESDSLHISIQHVLKRKSVIQRQKLTAQHDTQVIAANVDFMFVVSSLNEDFDLVQMSRYLSLGRDSGATPIILLTKADLCPNPNHFVKLCQSEFNNVEIILISTSNLLSLESLQKYFMAGKTSVLIGSSGVGKSTLTNFLIGSDLQKTQGLSAESRGRHTTTARDLIVTHWGGFVIDTPGMQEVSAVGTGEQKAIDFSVIEQLMLQCKFTNCRHENDPGCAVTAALKSKTLSRDEWDKFLTTLSKINRKKNK
jgi:ribosome biogenesis GTPase